jgi:anti-sigma factor RsiW
MNACGQNAPSEFELMAYVDGELDSLQRLEIEDWLARDPDLAAQVMGDILSRDALVLTGNASPPPLSCRTLGAARKLEATLARQGRMRILRWPLALAAFAGIGCLAQGPVSLRANGNSPPVVSDSGMAHRAGSLRTRLRPQGRGTEFGRLEVGSASRQELPAPARGKANDMPVRGRLGPALNVQPRLFQPRRYAAG